MNKGSFSDFNVDTCAVSDCNVEKQIIPTCMRGKS
jgi:hypothetical protein